MSKYLNKGMTYIELIVVFSIFSTLAAVVLFNYGAFQGRIDIKNLSNDLGLRIVQAQKYAMSGVMPNRSGLSSSWRPSYGMYMNLTTDNKSFIYFTDINQNGKADDTVCAGSGECLEKVLITKSNYISSVKVYYSGNPTPTSINDLSVTFIRPSSTASFASSVSLNSGISYVEITVSSPKAYTGIIKIYPSGKIDIN